MSEPTPTDATPAKPAGASKLPLVIGMVVAAAAAGGGAWTFAQKDAEKKIKAATLAAKAHPAAAAAAEGGASGAAEEAEPDDGNEEGGGGGEGAKTVNLAPFLVNLGPDITDMHYLKVSIGAEVPNEEAGKAFEEHSAKVRNNVLMYLSNLKADEIQGAEARDKIMARLRVEVKKAVGSKNVRGVYLTEFVIQ